jgi:hypothetical protein
MRDAIVHKWSNDMGNYAVRTRFVELFYDAEGDGVVSLGDLSSAEYDGDYRGVYIFMEKIKRDGDRVDIAKLEPEDIYEPEVTGGYILKGTTGGEFDYPEEPQNEQQDYIEGYIDDFETVLYSANFTDPIAGYSGYIDVDSFIDYGILIELAKSFDWTANCFTCKDRNGKLVRGPVWDFDLSLGNFLGDGLTEDGWVLRSTPSTNWHGRLTEDIEYQLSSADRWYELRKKILHLGNLCGDVDEFEILLEEAAVRNYQRWNINGPTGGIGFKASLGSFEAEVDWLRRWLVERLEWLDQNYGPIPSYDYSNGELIITAPSGVIYYTLDGSDPREPFTGDAVGSQYTGPITLTSETVVSARILDGNDWSALNRDTFAAGLIAENLRITEIMYHPAPPELGSTYDEDDFEYIELKNIGSFSLNLNLAKFAAGIDFTFSNVALASGQCAVVVKNQAAFFERYPAFSGLVLGEYSGKLSDGGENVKLEDATGQTVLGFEYEDNWYLSTDGGGYSLTILTPSDKDLFGWCIRSRWRTSVYENGSPGVDEVGFASWYCPTQCHGDADGDGDVDTADWPYLRDSLFSNYWDHWKEGYGSYEPKADFNHDGDIDTADWPAFRDNCFTSPPADCMPEWVWPPQE